MDLPPNDTVQDLLVKPFKLRSNEDQINIIMTGRPKAPIQVTASRKRKDGRISVISYKPQWLQTYEWLCTSPSTNKMFCWPCLLFSTKKYSWTADGFSGFENVNRAMIRHSESIDHIGCSLDMKQFCKKISGCPQENPSHILEHNASVTINREVIQTAFKAAVLLSKLDFRGHNDYKYALTQGNFKELFSVMLSEKSEEVRDEYEKSKAVFSCDSETTHNEIIETISNHLDAHIKKEITETEFFSIQIVEKTDNQQIAQFSIIMRFVNDKGQLKERFLGFFNVSWDKTASGLFKLLDSALKPFDYQTKLVGQCYNGVSVMAGHINDLQQKVKQVCPQAIFVHCLAHHLNLVLQQCLKHLTKCRIFFANLLGIASFFHSSSNRTHVLNSCGISNLATRAEARWSSIPKLTAVLIEDWQKLKEVFQNIVDLPDADAASTSMANSFLHNFNSFEFTFLAVLFNDVFNLTDKLYQVLQSRSLDVTHCKNEIEKTYLLLQDKQNEEVFAALLAKSIKLTELDETRGNEESEMKITYYRSLFFQVMDTICTDFKTRFADIEKLKFVSLIDPTKFGSYVQSFPSAEFDSLISMYKQYFTKPQKLKAELQYLYKREKEKYLYKKEEEMKTPPTEILLDLKENEEIFGETYKLYSLILTMPSVSVSLERNFSCVKRLKMYLRNSSSEKGLSSSLAKISIEKELLSSMLEDPGNFYETLVDKYASKKKSRKRKLTKEQESLLFDAMVAKFK